MSLSEHEAEFHGRPSNAPPPQPARLAVEPNPTTDPGMYEASDVEEPSPGPARDAEAERARAEATDPNSRYEKREPRQRHRAASQQAKPEDVAEIQSLTAQLRSKEAELLKAKPQNGNAPSARALNLRRQIRGIEAELAELQPAPKAETRQPERPASPQPAPAALRPKPSEADLGTKYQTYQELTEDLADWKWEQREAQRQADEKAAADARKAQEAKDAQQQTVIAYRRRADAFAAQHPDFNALVAQRQAEGYDIPPLVTKIVMEDDNGPALLYHALKSPELLDELWRHRQVYDPNSPTVDADIQRDLVATRRYLNQRASAGTTGAATPPPASRAPRPLTPVRTGPVSTGNEPPDDDAPLSAHEAAYSRKRRR